MLACCALCAGALGCTPKHTIESCNGLSTDEGEARQPHRMSRPPTPEQGCCLVAPLGMSSRLGIGMPGLTCMQAHTGAFISRTAATLYGGAAACLGAACACPWPEERSRSRGRAGSMTTRSQPTPHL